MAENEVRVVVSVPDRFGMSWVGTGATWQEAALNAIRQRGHGWQRVSACEGVMFVYFSKTIDGDVEMSDPYAVEIREDGQ